MKESELIMIRNKVESLGELVQMMHYELSNMRELSVGTMELVKKLPDYEKALEELKESIKENEGPK